MATLIDTPEYTPDEIYEIQGTDPVQGAASGAQFGGLGIDNQPHQQLANRTAFLFAQVRTVPWSSTLWIDTGATNAIAITLSPAPTSLAALTGVPLKIQIANTTTGAFTVNPNGLGAVPVIDQSGAAFTSVTGAGAALAGDVDTFIYNGTAFVYHPTLGRLLNVQIFMSSSTYTPTPGMRRVIFKVQGAGAAGSGVSQTEAGAVTLGSPGGSGSFAKGVFTNIQVGASLAVTVGPGGLSGGASSVGTIITAPGGVAGGELGNQIPPSINGTGSNAGAPAGGNISSTLGSGGMPAFALSTSEAFAGIGGSSVYGPGAQGLAINTDGVPALNIGCGGSGCVVNSGGGDGTGGAGFRGQVEAWEYS
jgi:hypothetical protein